MNSFAKNPPFFKCLPLRKNSWLESHMVHDCNAPHQRSMRRCGMRSRVFSGHSSLLFILGFLTFTQKVSRSLCAVVLASSARIVTYFYTKIISSTKRFFVPFVPISIYLSSRVFHLSSRCSLVLVLNRLPVSPIYSSAQVLQEMRYIVSELMQSPSLL